MPVAPASTPSRVFALTCVAALLAYGAFLTTYSSPVAAGSDSAGYLLSAKLLTEGDLTTPLRTVPGFASDEVWENTPLGMIHSERLDALIPTYPIGLPLFYAAAATLAGWNWGPVLVAVLMALGAVVFTVLCAREVGVRREIAGIAGVALALCPLVFYTTLLPLSDTASTCWNALTILCAWRARGGFPWRWSIAAGAGFAVSVLLRPSNMLLLPALVVALGHPRLIAGAFLGGLPGAVLLGWYHHALYGNPLVTGYGAVWSMFGAEHVLPSLYKYSVWVPAFLPFALAGLVLAPWLPWRTRWREITVLLLWIVAYAAFFAFYPPTHEHRWYLRFVLPAFPALLILGALAIEGVLARLMPRWSPRVTQTALLLFLALNLGFGWHHWRTSNFRGFAIEAEVYREVPRWVDATLPSDAIVLTLHQSCSFYFYSDRAIIRSDTIKPPRFAALVEFARATGRPVYAIVTRGDDEPTFTQRLPGAWTEERRKGNFGVWRLDLPAGTD